MSRIKAIRKTAKENMGKTQSRYKADYDKTVTQRKEFHVGQWVFDGRL